MSTLIDGCPEHGVPADDRGLLYGESVFETIGFKNQRAGLWPEHMARLQHAASALHLECPEPERLLAECLRLLPERGRHIVRITLSAASGGAGYWPSESGLTRRIVSRRDWPDGIQQQRRDGLRLALSSIRLPVADVFQGIKHGNRLLQVAAARECRALGLEEAVLLDAQGYLMEAISSNLVMVRDGVLIGHPNPAVAGVGLAWLKRQADVLWESQALSPSDLSKCSEVLVINSVAGVRPVIEVDGQGFAIGSMCRHLQSLWEQNLH